MGLPVKGKQNIFGKWTVGRWEWEQEEFEEMKGENKRKDDWNCRAFGEARCGNLAQ